MIPVNKIYSRYRTERKIAYCYNQSLTTPNYRENIAYNEGVSYSGIDEKHEDMN